MEIKINTEALSEVGENVKATVQNGLLILVIDTTVDLGPSASGKMNGVGSTGGFTPFPGGLSANVWVGRKKRHA